MNPKVVTVDPLPGYFLKLRFESGEVKLFDVKPYLDKGVFQELRDIEYFNQVRVSFGSVEWPREQDLSRDTLYLLGRLEPV